MNEIRCIYIPIIGKPMIILIPRDKFNPTVRRLISADVYGIAPLCGSASYHLIVDDNGLLMDKPVNPLATFLYASDGRSVIVGTAVLVNTGLVDGEPDVISMTESDAEHILDLLIVFRTHYLTEGCDTDA